MEEITRATIKLSYYSNKIPKHYAILEIDSLNAKRWANYNIILLLVVLQSVNLNTR